MSRVREVFWLILSLKTDAGAQFQEHLWNRIIYESCTD